MTKKNELKILFPETQIKLPDSETSVTVKPFNFKQTGQVLTLIAPCVAALSVQMSGDKIQLLDINFPALVFNFVQNDCAIALDLAAMATPLSRSEVEALTASDGFALLKGVFEVALTPLLALVAKKSGPADPAPEAGETLSLPSPKPDSAEPTLSK